MLLSKLKQILRGLKNLLLRIRDKSANCISLLRLFINSYKEVKNQKILIVSIADFNHGRYGFQLINYFSKGGYHIVFYKSNKFLLRLFGYDRLIFTLQNCSLWRKDQFLKTNNIYWLRLNVSDYEPPPFKSRKEIEVDLNYFQSAADDTNSFSMPYYVHPLMNENISFSSPIVKKNKLLFYGQDDLPSNTYWIEDYFKLLPRKKVFSFIQKSGLEYVSPATFSELIEKLNDNNYRNAFFFIDSKKVWIPANQWISILGRFEFFIATPGVYMPLSHNIIEAMSQNTVPILQYSEQFRPNLQDSVNCLVFKNLSELRNKILFCGKILSEDLNSLQQNLNLYYKSHITPSSFLRKIEQSNQYNIKLYFNAEELSLQTPGNNLK